LLLVRINAGVLLAALSFNLTIDLVNSTLKDTELRLTLLTLINRLLHHLELGFQVLTLQLQMRDRAVMAQPDGTIFEVNLGLDDFLPGGKNSLARRDDYGVALALKLLHLGGMVGDRLLFSLAAYLM
jgi:hypothetical protein